MCRICRKGPLGVDGLNYFSFRYESAAEPDPVPPCARGNVPRDPGGGNPDPIHPDAPRPTNSCTETLRTLTDVETRCCESDKLPGKVLHDENKLFHGPVRDLVIFLSCVARNGLSSGFLVSQ